MKVLKIACIVFIVTSITWSCSESGEKKSSVNKQESKQEKVKKPVQPAQSPQLQTTATPAGETDQFGRKPGEAHYGHNHASDQPHTPPVNSANTPQVNPTGGPDKFGRNPGDPHYGHDHE